MGRPPTDSAKRPGRSPRWQRPQPRPHPCGRTTGRTCVPRRL